MEMQNEECRMKKGGKASAPVSGDERSSVLLLFCILYSAPCLVLSCASYPRSEEIHVSEVTLFGDMECFRVQTPTATYLYGKRGAGFASILDPDGHDWISYRPGGKALGEYRGLPKCGQPVKFFHCGYSFGQYTNSNEFTSRVTISTPRHVRIESETRQGDAACAWDFFSAHATLTLRRIGTTNFWFLYEGTPGGRLDADADFVVRPNGRRTTTAEPWEENVPWVCFGAQESPWALLCVRHDPDGPAASYVAWPYKPEADGGFQQMTVFGWGRLGWQDPKQHQPQMRELPARFSIGFIRGGATVPLTRSAAAAARAMKEGSQ
jgi:hypothetical protein